MVGLKCGSDICLTDITLNEKIINRQNIGSDNTIVTKCTEHCDYLKTSFDKQVKNYYDYYSKYFVLNKSIK